MQDPEPPQDFPTVESDSDWSPPGPERQARPRPLRRRRGASRRDRPIAPSSLLSEEDVDLELRREDVRDRRWNRRGSIVLVLVLSLIVFVSAAVLALGISTSEPRLVLSALAPLSAAAAGVAFLCRALQAGSLSAVVSTLPSASNKE